MTTLIANMMNVPTLLIVLLVVLLLFGSSKLPQLMRGLGTGINEFKKGLKEGESAPGEKKEDAPKPPAPPEAK